MLSGDLLRDLASRLYDAALGQTSWVSTLSVVAAAFSSTKGTLLSQDLDGSRATVLGAAGFDREALAAYEAYYRTRNVFLLSNTSLLVPGLVRVTDTTVPPDVLFKSEYYNDFMRRIEMRHGLGVTVKRAGQEAVHITVFRPGASGPYGDEETRAMRELLPHFERAFQVHERLAAAQQHTDAMGEALERCGKGVALLDWRGRPVFVNSALQTIFNTRDGLGLTREGVSLLARDANRALHGFIANAAAGGSGGTLAVSRPSGAPPYSVLVSPVPKRAPVLACGDAAVLLIVSDPATAVRVDVKLLQIAYGLTFAEARIASRLANGATIDAVAKQLGIAVSTARTHLKRILQKTGTSRQSELVRLVLLTR